MDEIRNPERVGCHTVRMTDSDPTAPGAPTPPAPGSTPPPPPPTDAPTEPVPTTPGDAEGAAASETAPTETMPATPPPPGAIPATGDGVPPVPPPDAPVDGEEGDDVPWYKTPLGIAGLILGGLLIVALLIWFFWGNGDDDGEVVSARVVFETKDPSGAALDRGFVADVQGTSEFPQSFIWVEPQSAPGPEGIGSTTGDSGRITFAWGPAAEVVEPSLWTSTITLVENAPAGFTPPGPVVECVLERPEVQNSTVSMNVVADPPDPAVDQLVTYTFPNHEFLPGDTVTCELVSQLPPETTTSTTTTTTTTVPETTTTTTVVETTTTVVETTVPPTAAPTTAAPTTAAPTTAAPTTAPPAGPATATEALQAAGNYGTFLSLAAAEPAVQALLDGAGPITVFAPNDAALAGVDPATVTEELLLSHIVNGEALDAAALFDGSRTEITMASGGTQPVDQAASTVGGASVTQADLTSVNGVSHGVGAPLPAAP